MKSRLEAIALRRTALVAEISQERANLNDALSTLRKRLALASLGLVVGQALSGRPWLRALVIGGLAVFVGRRLATRLKGGTND
jgi:hypothetical protein